MTFCPFTNRIPFGLLTDEEKKILKAEKPWEIYDNGIWSERMNPLWSLSATYRRKKMPVIEKVSLVGGLYSYGWVFDKHTDNYATHKITYNIVDGEVDVFSCVMEKL